jgi:hypothetical protein
MTRSSKPTSASEALSAGSRRRFSGRSGSFSTTLARFLRSRANREAEFAWMAPARKIDKGGVRNMPPDSANCFRFMLIIISQTS